MNPERDKKPGRPRAEERSPMLPAKIMEAYVETGSLEKTATRCGIAANTVKAILTRHPEDFATVKKALASKMMAVADAAVDIAGERLDECSAPQAAVVAGIFTQRGTELLDSAPPQQVTLLMVHENQLALLMCKEELRRRGLEPPLTPEQAADEERTRQFLIRTVGSEPRPEWMDGEPAQPTEVNVTPQSALPTGEHAKMEPARIHGRPRRSDGEGERN